MKSRNRPLRFLGTLGVLLVLFAARPTNGQLKQGGACDGHSYLHIEIAGHAVTNIVQQEKYGGWLQISYIRAKASQPPAAAGSSAPAKSNWTSLSTILRTGRAGAGKIRFGVGDHGELVALVDAQKRGAKIATAQLDLYDENSGSFLGAYELKGIRVLSLEDVPASACAMYSITLSFESTERRKV
ncbi:MAG: hypothetical protein ACRD59_18785 [Candidatus Acidiferrales bacterium]